MIKKIEVKGLHNHSDHEIVFHNDISLLTGRNGCGKTAIIKLAWYLTSGNIERTLREINFRSVKVTTDKCIVSVGSKDMKPATEVNIEVDFLGASPKMSVTIPRQEWDARNPEIDVINGHVARATGSSLFFPTFRRIEGGFATSNDLLQQRGRMHAVHALSNALESYVDAISVYKHHFVATLSTQDVHALLTEKFADASRNTDEIHRQLYTDLKSKIGAFTKEQSVKKLTATSYKKTLDALTKILEKAEADRNKTLERFEQLGEIIKGIFSHKGIQLTKSITFGDPLNAVKSDLLSAGEKQFLSFLCYNAFLTDSVVIIDEPEISLHPDWQRRLIPTLKSQNSGNQFILTTHSPFIYSKFPQREICLSNDKGE
jgi:energy-coupling factor transporter ATP-binding protein EcfA2